MIIDCSGCVMRDVACEDCVVSFLLGPAERLEPAEQTALAVLADGGLVPPMRMRPDPAAAVAHGRPGRAVDPRGGRDAASA